MVINVKLVGLFKTGRFRQKNFTCPRETKIQDIINQLELPQQHHGIILLNGFHASSEASLKPDDKLVLLPLVDGG